MNRTQTIIGVIGLIVAIVACAATYLALPQIQRLIDPPASVPDSSTASGAVKQAFDAAISGDLSRFAKSVAPDSQEYASWDYIFEYSGDLSTCRGIKYQTLERPSQGLGDTSITLVFERPCGQYNSAGTQKAVRQVEAFVEKVNNTWYLLPIGARFFHLSP